MFSANQLKSAFCLLVITPVLLTSTPARPGPIVAVFDVEDKGSGLEKGVLSNLVDYLAARLTECGYQVVPQEQIRSRLKAMVVESHKECVDQSCQIELGRELAAQKTLSTKILGIGDSCKVTSVLYDLKKAATESAATAGSACEVNELLKAINDISVKLCAPLGKSQEKPEDLAGFEEIRKTVEQEKAELERMEKAWKMVSRIAKDESIKRETRVRAVQKFISNFKLESAVLKEARKVLAEIHLATLDIRSTPAGATILLDGESLGKSPLTAEVKAGDHEMIAKLDGYMDAHAIRKVAPGQNSVVHLSMRVVPPGRLTVRSDPPGAAIFIDGANAGNAPVSREVVPGEHRLEARMEGYQTSTMKAVVEQGKLSALRIKLEPAATGKLEIATKPAGAEVSIDGAVVGTAPVAKELPGGVHRLKATLDGHLPAERTESVELGRTLAVTIELEKEKTVHLYHYLGHAAFWTGLGAVAFGGAAMGMSIKYAGDYDDGDLSAADSSIAWEGGMWVGFSAGAVLIITGLVLWALEPDESADAGSLSATAGLAPNGQGMVFGLGGRW